MLSVEQQIKQLKEQYNQANIRKGVCEVKLTELKDERTNLQERCTQLGVTPETLAQEIANKEQKQQSLLSEVNKLLGNVQEDINNESPF